MSYYYQIGGVGFGFETPSDNLFEYSPYDVFRISSDKFFSLDERHHYIFNQTPPELTENGRLINSTSSCDIYQTENEYIHVNKRFDKEKYECIVVSPKNQSGGCFYYTDNSQDKLKVTTELFRCCDFLSALLYYRAVIIHASYIIFDGQAILFTAESGGGKSTQADLWQKYESAQIINGDRAVIKKEDDGWFVHSLPLCGSSGICLNKSAKLRAVVSLNKDDKNRVEKLTPRQKLNILMNQLSFEAYKKDDFDKALNFIDEMISHVDFISLNCTPDDRAVKTLKDYLNGGEAFEQSAIQP